MFPTAAPTEPARTTLPAITPVSNWSVALYRKAEPILPLNPSDVSPTPAPQQTYGSFYVQLQHQACSASPSRSDVLYFRYQAQLQRNTAESYTLPFTVSQLSDMKLSSDVAPLASTSIRATNTEQHAGKRNERWGPGRRRTQYHFKSYLKPNMKYLHRLNIDIVMKICLLDL